MFITCAGLVCFIAATKIQTDPGQLARRGRAAMRTDRRKFDLLLFSTVFYRQSASPPQWGNFRSLQVPSRESLRDDKQAEVILLGRFECRQQPNGVRHQIFEVVVIIDLEIRADLAEPSGSLLPKHFFVLSRIN